MLVWTEEFIVSDFCLESNKQICREILKGIGVLEQKQEKLTGFKNWSTNYNKMLLELIFNFERYGNVDNNLRWFCKIVAYRVQV